MTKESKELLLKDLCGRLPYGVKGNFQNSDDELLRKVTIVYSHLEPNGMVMTGDIKPYLFPLSSMTNEQEEELYILLGNESVGFQRYDNAFLDKDGYSEVSIISILKGIDWLNANHFDYRGLIEKSLALDATNLDIYKAAE